MDEDDQITGRYEGQLDCVLAWRDDPEEDVRKQVSVLWAEDWDCPEDSVYDCDA